MTEIYGEHYSIPAMAINGINIARMAINGV